MKLAVAVAMACLTRRVALAQATPPVITLSGAPARLSDGIDQVSAVRELSDGTAIVLSNRSKVPLLADYRSGVISDVSSEGDGPGEFRQPSYMVALPAESTLVLDNGRWVVLDGVRPVATLGVWSVHACPPALSGVDQRGRVLESRPSKYGKPSDVQLYPVHTYAESLFILAHRRTAGLATVATTNRVDTIAHIRGSYRGVTERISGSFRGKGVGHQLVSILTGEEQGLLFLDGWIAIAFAEPYRVDWISPAGNRIIGVPVAVRPRSR